jgi:glycosyltransferase involved in cell wall biosynthesis
VIGDRAGEPESRRAGAGDRAGEPGSRGAGERAVGRPAPELSLLIPLYNEEENLPILLDRVAEVMERLGRTYEVVLVDDGSTDRTPALLRKAVAERKHLRAVLFRRNSGQTAALAAAIQYSAGEILIPLDGDLQNDPQDIPRLLDKLSEGYDVVSGWRRNRQDTFITRILPSILANGLISLISGVKLHDYGCTLKAYRREVLTPIQLLGEMHRFIPILATWQGAKVAEVEVSHHARTHGKSKYGLGRTFKVILDLLTIKFMGSFITKPIYAFGGTGAFLFFLSGILAAYTLYEKIADDVWVHRNPVFMLSIFFALVGMQLVMMGLLGELLIRIYFASSNSTPYVVREVLESPCAESPVTG